MIKRWLSIVAVAWLISGCAERAQVGRTEITRWQYGKKGAVSLTYDDGSVNQFRFALPVMRRLQLPATFFIITGPVTGSHYQGKFIGRPVKDIIAESAQVPTGADNFFERASAAKYLGYEGTLAYYDRADAAYEDGKKEAAWRIMDSLYDKVRSGALQHGQTFSDEVKQEKGLTWDSLRQYASEGYEPASHTVTHAHLAILDTANMRYELEKSKEDIREHLGAQYTFSAEVPYGIEDPRVMHAALPVYPALRNSMPEPFMKEINRGYKDQPGASGKEYVQWQRGPLSKTPLTLMEAWVDTTLAHDNIWLVLVFHGVDGIGWEALPHEFLDTYFRYIKKHEDDLWIATFGDVARYIRERMNARVQTDVKTNKITVSLHHSLDTALYPLPLTLKTYVPESWKEVSVEQGNNVRSVQPRRDKEGSYVLYQAKPDGQPAELTRTGD